MFSCDGVLIIVVSGDGYREIQAEKGANAAGIDDEVIAEPNPPLGNKRLETRHDARVGEQKYRAAALQVGPDGIDFRWKHRGTWPGDDENSTVLRHPTLTCQKQ